MDYPNPWQSMEPWRRAVLVGAAVVVVLSYVVRHAAPSTDLACRTVVVLVGLVSLALWAGRPRPPLDEGPRRSTRAGAEEE